MCPSNMQSLKIVQLKKLVMTEFITQLGNNKGRSPSPSQFPLIVAVLIVTSFIYQGKVLCDVFQLNYEVDDLDIRHKK